MFRNIKIGHRLASAFGALLLLILASAAVGLVFVNSMGEVSRVLYAERAKPIQQMSQINYLTQRNRVLVMDMLINPGSANVEQRVLEFRANTDQLDALWQEAGVAMSASAPDAYAALRSAHDEYMKQGLAVTSEAMAQNRYDDAQEFYLNKISPLAPPVQAQMDRLLAGSLALAEAEYQGV